MPEMMLLKDASFCRQTVPAFLLERLWRFFREGSAVISLPYRNVLVLELGLRHGTDTLNFKQGTNKLIAGYKNNRNGQGGEGRPLFVRSQRLQLGSREHVPQRNSDF